MLLLFLFVLGGIYGGLVHGAGGRRHRRHRHAGDRHAARRLPLAAIRTALIDALRVSSAIMLIVVGAYLFGYFLTITQFTQKAVDLLVAPADRRLRRAGAGACSAT